LTGALGPSDVMVLGGLIAHYSSHPGARAAPAAEVLAELRRRQRSLVALAGVSLRTRAAGEAGYRVAAFARPLRGSDEPAAG
jgi:hypothetical protein